jgi:hypothetical protein
LTDAVGVANGEYHVSHPEIPGLADRNDGKVPSGRLEYGQVRFRIGTDRFDVEIGAVREYDPDRIGILDDVSVREQEAVTRQDHSRAQAGRLSVAVALGQEVAELVLQEGIPEGE